MSYGLAAECNDVALSDFARLADAFYLGGTKCGALFGEAVVVTNERIASHFRSYIKRAGGMLAKGWLLGVQFSALLEDGLYFDIARTAVQQAMRIRRAFAEAGVPAYIDSPTNQQFVVVTDDEARYLAASYVYEPELRLSDGRRVIRFCVVEHARLRRRCPCRGYRAHEGAVPACLRKPRSRLLARMSSRIVSYGNRIAENACQVKKNISHRFHVVN